MLDARINSFREQMREIVISRDVKTDIQDIAQMLYNMSFNSKHSLLSKDIVANGYESWFGKSIAISPKNPRQISYARDGETQADDKRRYMTSYSKFLRKFNNKFWVLDEKNIEAFAETMATFPFTELIEYEFNIVEGDDVVKMYNEQYFGSCMHDKEHLTQFYADNPHKVKGVRIEYRGELVGRALLWDTDQDVKILDRIYPSDGGKHINAAIAWANERGYLFKTRQAIGASFSKDGRFTVSGLQVNGRVPYMDSFVYAMLESDDTIILSNQYLYDDNVRQVECQSTDGTMPFPYERCHCCRRRTRGHSGVAIRNGTYVHVCINCLDTEAIRDRHGSFMLKSDAVFSKHYGGWVLQDSYHVFCADVDSFIHKYDDDFIRYNGEWRLRSLGRVVDYEWYPNDVADIKEEELKKKLDSQSIDVTKWRHAANLIGGAYVSQNTIPITNNGVYYGSSYATENNNINLGMTRAESRARMEQVRQENSHIQDYIGYLLRNGDNIEH